ncbi:MAG: cobyrinate a,c-diamide synthase [Nitrospirae bacterium]|nr:cobyrinate a,c-diamide synthase [Nitrospirota bacterium]
MNVPRLVIAGTGSNVGKTTVTLALLAALRQRGRKVQPFKVGPDYIDPGHHTMATGRPSRNLDGWMLGAAVNREIFGRAAADADISIIEGMMGLFDGSSPTDESGSTAELAKQLGAPVLLVIDGSAMARSAAAMVLGYARFDPKLNVAGVLFNRVGSASHYRLLKEAVEAETNLVVVGYLKPDPTVTVPDRHLGLVTAIEQGSTGFYDRLAKAAIEMVDLDRVETIARSSGGLPPLCKGREGGVENSTSPSPSLQRRGRVGVRVGVAYDQAFCFYYAENLELLEAAGAEIVKFSPLKDQSLPDIDLLYLGGGYPELHGAALAGNQSMKNAIRSFAGKGGPIYAECGGMMYLTQAIRDLDGRSHDMVGLFPAEAVMSKQGLTIGYREVELARPCLLGESGIKARGHEFHYSSLAPRGLLDYGCRMTDARGAEKGQDGLSVGNVVALYAHLHFSSQPSLAHALVTSARVWKERCAGSQVGIR